ncbi:MAG: hypothetical protein IPG70_03455 [Moraxellaceae bacterium]|nr:hypothetical protein [Moraxellaceae bacterium]
MNTQEVLKMAFDCGVLIQVKGDKLHLEAKEAPPNHLLAELKANKSELITLLATKAHPPMEDGQHSPTVEATPLNFMERNALLVQSEKPLFYHALDCSICNIEKARYCANGYAIGSVYDALLLVCEDTQARREDLALRIDKACISGRAIALCFD